MSYTADTETIFALESSEMSQVFSIVHEIFLSNGFHVELGSSLWLEDIDDVNGDWYEFESVCLDLETQSDVTEAVNKLKNHKTGGCLSYLGSDGYDGSCVHLTCFGSLDNNLIQYVLISISESHFNHYASIFNPICTEIFKKLNVKGATRRVNQDNDAYNACDIAEHILNETFSEIEINLELINEFN